MSHWSWKYQRILETQAMVWAATRPMLKSLAALSKVPESGAPLMDGSDTFRYQPWLYPRLIRLLVPSQSPIGGVGWCDHQGRISSSLGSVCSVGTRLCLAFGNGTCLWAWVKIRYTKWIQMEFLAKLKAVATTQFVQRSLVSWSLSSLGLGWLVSTTQTQAWKRSGHEKISLLLLGWHCLGNRLGMAGTWALKMLTMNQ